MGIGQSIPGVAAVLLVSSCVLSTGPLGRGRDRLADARRVWVQRGPASYAFTYTRACFCGWAGAYRIEVEADTITRVTALPSGDVLADRPADVFYTVDGLFGMIGDVLDRRPDAFHASYDSALGHPVELSVDYIKQAVDDEFGFTVSDFQTRNPHPLLAQ